MRPSILFNKPLALTGLGRPDDAALTPEQVHTNARHLVMEVTWYGILVGTTINLMQVYVVRLGAPSLLVGAVTFVPALVSIFWQIPAAQWMRQRGRRMRWVLGTGLLHRLAYLVIAALPFLVGRGEAGAAVAMATVAVLAVQAFATTLSATSFLSMMADAIPADQIPQVVSGRMAGYGLTSTLSTLLAGLLLTVLPFPANYQVLFLIGFVASMLSQWHVSQISVPDRQPARSPGVQWLRDFGHILRLPRFVEFVSIVGVIQMALGMVVPLLPLFAVRRLGATDGQVSVIVTIFSASSVFGSLWMRRVVRRIGRERGLTGGALGYTFYPLLLSISPSVLWLMPWAALGGLFYAAISVTLFDNLLSVTPEGDRTNHVALYNLFVNAALFLGPLLATLVAHGTDGPGLALRLASGISLLAGVLCLLWLRGRRTGQAVLVGGRDVAG